MEKKDYLMIIIPILTGVLGYIFREWQHRFKPYIKLHSFGGGLYSGSSEVEISKAVCDKLKRTMFINSLEYKTELDNVRNVRVQIESFLKLAPKIIDKIDILLSAISNRQGHEKIFRCLKDVLSDRLTDFFIVRGYVTKLLRLDKKDLNTKISDNQIIELEESEDLEGCYILTNETDFIILGSDLKKDEMNKKAFIPLKDVILQCNWSAIHKYMTDLKLVLEKELDIANYAKDELQNILDENSRWEAKLYITNLNKQSMLLDNNALLYVKDDSSNTLFQAKETCELAIIKLDDDGNETRQRLNAPLIIHGEECVYCCFLTKNTQKQMNGSGCSFREVFNKAEEQAFGWLDLTIETAGLIKRKRIRTKKVHFKEGV